MVGGVEHNERALRERERHRFECEGLWPRIWHMACRLDQVANVGDFVEYRIADQSAFVIRAGVGLKAFLNRCTHRKARIVDGEGYCSVNYLTCPLHGWRWHLDGTIKYVVQQHLINDRDRPVDTLNLVACRMEVLGNWVFVNFDDSAPPMIEATDTLFTADFPSANEPFQSMAEIAGDLAASWETVMRAMVARLDFRLRLETGTCELSAGLRALHASVLPPPRFEQTQDVSCDIALGDLFEPLDRLLTSIQRHESAFGSWAVVMLANFVGLSANGWLAGAQATPTGEGFCQAKLWIGSPERLRSG